MMVTRAIFTAQHECWPTGQQVWQQDWDGRAAAAVKAAMTANGGQAWQAVTSFLEGRYSQQQAADDDPALQQAEQAT